MKTTAGSTAQKGSMLKPFYPALVNKQFRTTGWKSFHVLISNIDAAIS